MKKFADFTKTQQKEIKLQHQKIPFKSCIKCGLVDVNEFSYQYKQIKWIKYPSCCDSCINDVKGTDNCPTCGSKVSLLSLYCRKCSRTVLCAEKDKKDREIVDLYVSNNTITTKEIADIYNISQIRVQQVLTSRGGLQLSHHKFRCNEDILDDDTPFKYYFLGLMASDGHIGVNRNGKYIAISLNERDRVVLEDIKQTIDFNKPLYLDKDRQLSLCIYSDKLFDILESWGICQRKSLSLNLQKVVPKKFIYNFLQGVYEGDGGITGTKSADISFVCTASKSFAEQIYEMLKQNGHKCCMYSYKEKRLHRIYLVKKCGKKGLAILAKMYAMAPIFMPRKYEKFLYFVRPTTDEMFLNIAHEISLKSSCIRAKVGCIIADSHKTNIVSIGYNGQIRGGPNSCQSILPGKCGCIHAEENALIKNIYSIGVILYCTTLPCTNCAKLIIQGKIEKVYFSDTYRSQYSISLLRKAGIEVKHIPISRYRWKQKLLE